MDGSVRVLTTGKAEKRDLRICEGAGRVRSARFSSRSSREMGRRDTHASVGGGGRAGQGRRGRISAVLEQRKENKEEGVVDILLRLLWSRYLQNHPRQRVDRTQTSSLRRRRLSSLLLRWVSESQMNDRNLVQTVTSDAGGATM